MTVVSNLTTALHSNIGSTKRIVAEFILVFHPLVEVRLIWVHFTVSALHIFLFHI